MASPMQEVVLRPFVLHRMSQELIVEPINKVDYNSHTLLLKRRKINNFKGNCNSQRENIHNLHLSSYGYFLFVFGGGLYYFLPCLTQLSRESPQKRHFRAREPLSLLVSMLKNLKIVT